MVISMPKNVKAVIDILEKNGHEAYVVGGCVRDELLGRTPKDYDVATSAVPEETKQCFRNFKVVETGLKHGTVTVIMNGESFEVTTFRKDGSYSDRRRPDSVAFSSKLEDDLARRDFTVNAMAYNSHRGLIDLYGGQKDLFRRRIVCVGDPEKRFGEDALRIMRALRFASELGFSPEKNTAEAAHKMKDLLEEISSERVAKELLLLLCGTSPFEVLTEFSDIIAEIVPEIEPCIDFDQHSKYHIYDVWTHTASAVERSEADPDVRLALMLHDIGKPFCFKTDDEGNGHFYGHEKLSADIAENVMRRLRFPIDTIKRVSKLIRYHYVTPVNDDKVVKRLLSTLGNEDYFLLMEVMKGDNRSKHRFCMERVQVIEAMQKRAERIIAEDPCLHISDLKVNGGDMLELGFTGEAIGTILDDMLEAVIDERIPNERDALLRFARVRFMQR